ncbi:MAG: prolipoprotein diacylglyceryl transferase [Solirubrobacterales bacterium]|nr:prolipoprotein diacylglyceryl transferase [Solirubrobacterales bacterium]
MLVHFDIFGIQLQTFGIFFALTFIAAGLLVQRRYRELGWRDEWAWETIIFAIVGGLAGARIYWLLNNTDALSNDPLGAIFGGSGLTWFGGFAGGVLAVFIWSKWRRVPLIELFDVAGPCLALGYAIGRIGCQISGDGDYGRDSTLPWAMGYPDGTVPTAPGVTVHPTPVYETLVMGYVALSLWHLRGKLKPGSLFALWMVASSVERFLVEFIRRNSDAAIGLTQPQVWALVIGLAGTAWLVFNGKRGGLRLDQPDAQA